MKLRTPKTRKYCYRRIMCNGIVATYFACLEVNDLSDIPEGMIGFILPSQNYAKINCTNISICEAYNRIFRWMEENGYVQKFFENTFQVEFFYFEDNVEEEDVEILIPVIT